MIKRVTNLQSLRLVSLVTKPTVTMTSFVIIHLLIFSIFSSNYVVVNAQNNSTTTSSNLISPTMSPTTATKLNNSNAFIVFLTYKGYRHN
jgi:hypothetical protein